jgi:hypothetical protein
MDKARPKRAKNYPEVITRLPSAEIHVEGAKAWVLQSEASQLVFFEFAQGTKVPEHSHTRGQYGHDRMSAPLHSNVWFQGR